jgi:hypothetical protein
MGRFQNVISMKQTWGLTLLAAGLFVPLFVTRGVGWLDFWWWMAANLAILLALAVGLDAGWRAALLDDLKRGAPIKIGIGLLSALVLYGVFIVGNLLARQIFSFAGRGIADVYAFKGQVDPWRIALLMILIIGPGEELFWRGFVQRRLQNEIGFWGGFLAATAAYTLIHLGSGNLMLVLAAGVCGLFWGGLYGRTRSLLINVISHTAWDIAIFLLLPVR